MTESARRLRAPQILKINTEAFMGHGFPSAAVAWGGHLSEASFSTCAAREIWRESPHAASGGSDGGSRRVGGGDECSLAAAERAVGVPGRDALIARVR